MELEITNKLFLELSQVATATTAKEVFLLNMLRDANDALRSSMAIAERDGESVNWASFRENVRKVLVEQHRILFPLEVAIEKERP